SSLLEFLVNKKNFLHSFVIPCKISFIRKGSTSMPRKKKSGELPVVQVVFRITRDLHDALLTAAAGLGLDTSNLLRMMVAEHVAAYIERGKRAAVALEQARAQVGGAPETTERAAEGARQARVPGERQRRSIVIDPDPGEQARAEVRQESES